MEESNVIESPQEVAEVVETVQPSWLDSITDEVYRGTAENKGWKGTDDVIKSYKEAEKYLGANPKSLMRLPDQMNRENLNDIYSKLGMPEDPKGYGIEAPEGGEELHGKILELAHKIGLSKDQMIALNKFDVEESAVLNQAKIDSIEANRANDEQDLKKEWGMNFDANLSLARHGAKQIGVDEEAITAIENTLGYKKTMELFANAGTRFGEHEFRAGGTNQPQQYTPQGASAELDSLMNDNDFMAKIQAGDQDAIKRHQNLVRMMVKG